jgi:O-methyltransferase
MKTWFKQSIKELLFNSPLKPVVFHVYERTYMFSPQQLTYLTRCIEATRDLPGAIVEIGCAKGHTTVFLNKYMDHAKIEKPYICIDTFSGFTPSDADYEISSRHKRKDLSSNFRVNKKKWFDETMQLNGITRVCSYQGDINSFHLPNVLGEVSFCLIDVDLYLPVKSALRKVYPMMRNGIVVIDDCQPENIYDGALEAYQEFIEEEKLPPRVLFKKLGVVTKNLAIPEGDFDSRD